LLPARACTCDGWRQSSGAARAINAYSTFLTLGVLDSASSTSLKGFQAPCPRRPPWSSPYEGLSGEGKPWDRSRLMCYSQKHVDVLQPVQQQPKSSKVEEHRFHWADQQSGTNSNGGIMGLIRLEVVTNLDSLSASPSSRARANFRRRHSSFPFFCIQCLIEFIPTTCTIHHTIDHINCLQCHSRSNLKHHVANNRTLFLARGRFLNATKSPPCTIASRAAPHTPTDAAPCMRHPSR
jgi:hypothetical protein